MKINCKILIEYEVEFEEDYPIHWDDAFQKVDAAIDQGIDKTLNLLYSEENVCEVRLINTEYL